MAEVLTKLIREQPDEKLRKVKLEAAYPSPDTGKTVYTIVVFKHKKRFIGQCDVPNPEEQYTPSAGDIVDIRQPLESSEVVFPDRNDIVIVMRTGSEDTTHDKYRDQLKNPHVKSEDIRNKNHKKRSAKAV